MNIDLITQNKININKYSNHIRSFVTRNGRITSGQKHAINKYWSIMGINFTTELLSMENIFGRIAPVILEIGFGMGNSLVTMAKQNPQNNFIGIEVYLPGIGTCLRLAQEIKLQNLYIICHDAIEVLEYMIPDNSLTKLQLFFPDTWHKKRHHKRRIIQIPFLKLIIRKLSVNGILHISTDDQNYADYVLQIIDKITNYHNLSTDNKFINRPKYRPITKFEKRGYKLGHKIFDLMFQKYK